MIEIELLNDLDLPTDDQSVWNALLDKCEINTVFQTYQWLHCWWRTFRKEYQAIILLAKRDNKLVGVAPLIKYHARINGRTEQIVSFMGSPSHSADYCGFIFPRGESAVLEAFLQYLSHDTKWSLLNLSDIPSSSQQLQQIGQFFNRKNFLCCQQKLYDAPTLILSDKENNQKLIRKKSLVRHHNYFKRTGKLELRHFRTTEEAKKTLPLFFEQNCTCRQANNAPAAFHSQQQQLFAYYLTEELSATNWLDFSALYYNDCPIAFHLGFRYSNRFVWYQPCYDHHYSKHSPGEVLLKILLEKAIADNLEEFDFTVGSEQYKYRFANLIRSNSRVRIYRSSISYLLQISRNFIAASKRKMTNFCKIATNYFNQ